MKLIVLNSICRRLKISGILHQTSLRPLATIHDGHYVETPVNKHSGWCHEFTHTQPDYDWTYLLDKQNLEFIEKNIKQRKSIGDIRTVCSLHDDYSNTKDSEARERIRETLMKEVAKIPNITHSSTPIGPESKARVIATVGNRREFNFTPRSSSYLGRRLGILRTGKVTLTTGQRSYYFLDELVRLEEALVQFTLARLEKEGFTLVSVPDLLHPSVIESCGFPTSGERTQVYKLDGRHGDVCLAGTSELSLAGMLMNETVDIKDLPLKFAAVSRCFRAETSRIQMEKDLYRVHQFTKVEMFGVTANENGDESDVLQQKFLDIQRNLFRDLGIHFRILEMPTEELGNAAYRKFDIETWLPDRQFWGEISSTSNCTDYQSRRLAIKYKTPDHSRHVHTVNGTACAIPRMVMTIMENNQSEDGTITIPTVLQQYMGGLNTIKKRQRQKIQWQKMVT